MGVYVENPVFKELQLAAAKNCTVNPPKVVHPCKQCGAPKPNRVCEYCKG